MAFLLAQILFAIFFFASFALAFTDPSNYGKSKRDYYLHSNTFDPYAAKQNPIKIPVLDHAPISKTILDLATIRIDFDSSHEIFTLYLWPNEPVIEAMVRDETNRYSDSDGIRFLFGLFSSKENTDTADWTLVFDNVGWTSYGFSLTINNELHYDTRIILPIGLFYRVYHTYDYVDKDGNLAWPPCHGRGSHGDKCKEHK